MFLTRMAVVSLFAAVSLSAQTDPVGRWAKAAGGKEKLAAVTSTYREATLEFRGMRGTAKVWRTPDGRYRKEEQIGPFAILEVFDGTSATLKQGDAEPRVLTGPELARARGTAFANANAMFFAFFPEKRRGTLAVEGEDIVLRPEGGIDWRVTLDPETLLPKTMTHAEHGLTVTVKFVAWETVDGIQFEKELHRTTGVPGTDAVIRFTKTVLNAPVDDALFTLRTASPPPPTESSAGTAAQPR